MNCATGRKNLDSLAVFPYKQWTFEPLDVHEVSPLLRFFWHSRPTLSNKQDVRQPDQNRSWPSVGPSTAVLTVNKTPHPPLSITFGRSRDAQPFRARPRWQGVQADRAGDQVAGRLVRGRSPAATRHPQTARPPASGSNNCHNKGSTVDNKGARTTLSPWENFFQFNGHNRQGFPTSEGCATRPRPSHRSPVTAACSARSCRRCQCNGASIAAINAARTEYARLRSLMFRRAGRARLGGLSQLRPHR